MTPSAAVAARRMEVKETIVNDRSACSMELLILSFTVASALPDIPFPTWLLEPNTRLHPHGRSQETGAAMMLSLPSYTHRLIHGTRVAGMGKASYPGLGCYVNAEPYCSRWACSPTRSALRGMTLALFIGK